MFKAKQRAGNDPGMTALGASAPVPAGDNTPSGKGIRRTWFPGARQAKTLVLVLILLVIADGLISKFLTGAGMGQEGNPFLRIFIDGDQFMLLKVSGAVLAGILLLDFHRRHPRLAHASAVFLVAVYTAVVYWNLGIALFSA
jgi:hypothetical protein